MSQKDQPETGTPGGEPNSAKVIPFPDRSQRDSVPNLEELERWAKRAMARPRTGTIADAIQGLREHRNIAFEACCQVSLDGRPEAIEVAGNMLQEMNRLLEAIHASLPDPVPAAEHPIERDLEAVRSMPQSDDLAVETAALEGIAVTISHAIEKCCRATGVNGDLNKVGSMVNILEERIRRFKTMLKPASPPALMTKESTEALFAPGESPEAELGRLKTIVRLVAIAVHKSHQAGETEVLPSVGITLGMLEGRLHRLEGIIKLPTMADI